MNWLIKHGSPQSIRITTLRLRLGLCLALFIVLLASGCRGGGKKLAEHTEVSGTVLFNGTPLPGGRVSFFSKEGDPGTNAPIDLNGKYTIQAPIGDVKISVDNSMLKPGAAKGGGQRVGKQQGAGPRPGGDDPTVITGKYIEIPAKYADPNKSGLTYTVKKGEKEHDIILTGEN